MEQHNYYQPSEYEQQLIVTGAISEADVDTDFQEYLSRTKYDEFQLDYSSWINQKRYLDALNERYESEIEPFFPNLSYEQKELRDYLVREADYAESALGY